MKKGKHTQKLMAIYECMYNHFGPRGWWPGETAFEICVGAILTQSVSWKNVEKAINNLREVGLLDLESMNRAALEEIARCIVPTMYYRMKAKKLMAFTAYVTDRYDGNLFAMFDKELDKLREELLGIYGIGPETADSIILYAAEKPIFVVDAYTRRIFSRLGFFSEKFSYDEMQSFFSCHLPKNARLYNEYHAQIVGIGNRFCGNKHPKCTLCPLGKLCQYNRTIYFSD